MKPDELAGALGDAHQILWERFGDRQSLMSDLPADAVLARARSGESRESIPRLFGLIVTDQLGTADRLEFFRLLDEAAWQEWPRDDRWAILGAFDTWWTFTRSDSEPPLSAGTVLACLAHVEVPLVRWLGPWLEDLDGPGARHLADVVIDQLSDPEWEDRSDQRTQILQWTRSEPVILGLTLVGGVHLDPGDLGRALDAMLES